MIRNIGSLSEQDFNDWRLHSVTKRMFGYIEEQIEYTKSLMANGNTIMPEQGNGHHNIIRLLGLLDGLELINNMLSDDLLTEEELEENDYEA